MHEFIYSWDLQAVKITETLGKAFTLALEMTRQGLLPDSDGHYRGGAVNRKPVQPKCQATVPMARPGLPATFDQIVASVKSQIGRYPISREDGAFFDSAFSEVGPVFLSTAS